MCVRYVPVLGPALGSDVGRRLLGWLNPDRQTLESDLSSEDLGSVAAREGAM